MPPISSFTRGSFFLHLRPKIYRRDAIGLTNTWYLGMIAFFLLILELITGILLMVYYIPTPETAYDSIIQLQTRVPFGSLIRDLHRLGGEVLIVVSLLHMLRIILSTSYTKSSRFTWVTGVGLLLCTLLLAFTGYLLPWDQLAYWAVTIGISIADSLPGLGTSAANVLRGGAELGQEGLLRFYFLHIIGLPLLMALCMAMHYYRISRYGVTPPTRKNSTISTSSKSSEKQYLPLFPHIILLEFSISCLLLALLMLICRFLYDAPLGFPADPIHTPTATTAPWFFLWLQGALKLGDSLLMGISFPLLLLALLVFLPYYDWREKKQHSTVSPLHHRLITLVPLVLVIAVLLALSMVGRPQYGFTRDPVQALLLDYIPEEEPSVFHRLGYANLTLGIYEPGATEQAQQSLSIQNGQGTLEKSLRLSTSHPLQNVLERCGQEIRGLHLHQVKPLLIIEDWQAGLKKVTLRITWEPKPRDGQQTGRQSMERITYVAGPARVKKGKSA